MLTSDLKTQAILKSRRVMLGSNDHNFCQESSLTMLIEHRIIRADAINAAEEIAVQLIKIIMILQVQKCLEAFF